MTRIKTGTIALVGVLLLTGMLCFTPAASATSKQTKLTGVVVGKAKTCGVGDLVTSCIVVSLRRGSSKIGKLTVGTFGCLPRFCEYDGFGTLSVDKLKLPKQLRGKLHVKIVFRGSGGNAPYKDGTGKLYTSSGKDSVRIRINGNGISRKIGAHFSVVVSHPSVSHG